LPKIINKLKKKNIKVSLFINPNINDVEKSNKLGVETVEIHTGSFSKAINKKDKKKIISEFQKIKKCKLYCDKTKLNFNLGHGLSYVSLKYLKKIRGVNEYNIGHFIIGESLFRGFGNVITKFKRIIK
ncbi:MAG: pyridoxine 5'-phosphate synthase, partial [Candidatus Pelagibacter sp.]|nr:pyridoxine 5'-phosphate synthase [Candidatus Pelagibacter sp.]